MTVAYDSPGRTCLGPRDAPGTAALRDECMALFAQTENAGTCACRYARGTKSPSVHGECRAWDAHFDQPGRGLRNPAGDFLANFLVAQHDLLSVQCVIWNRRIWSVTRPFWRTYSGVNPHLDHVHVEHNWHGAKKCTRATVRLAYERWTGSRPSDAKPLPQKEDDMPAVILYPQGGGTSHLVLGDGSLQALTNEQEINDAKGNKLAVSFAAHRKTLVLRDGYVE